MFIKNRRRFFCLVFLLAATFFSLAGETEKLPASSLHLSQTKNQKTLPKKVQDVLNDLKVSLSVQSLPSHSPLPEKPLKVSLFPQQFENQSSPKKGERSDNDYSTVVSFAIPFGPGWCDNEKRIHVFDAQGNEINVFTKPIVFWWTGTEKGSVRSALIQFEMNFKTSAPQTVTVKITKPRERSRTKEIPVPKTLFTRRFSAPGTAFDYQCPKVLAVLSPEWLCSSLVAWQQVPVSQNKNCAWYDQYFLKHFDASLPNLASKRYTAHLFDRTATYAKFYIRHGDPRFLLAAIQAEEFYLQQIKPDGIFKLKRKPDYKYSLNEGSAILYMLTGDPRYKKVIERLLKPWAKWDRESNPTQNYTPGVYLWTERHHGFGMVSYLHAFEITGQQDYLNQAKGYFDTVLAMQISPADKNPPDGAWRHLAKDHGDGNGWATSPWMSAFLVDAIWKYWMLSDDARAPASLALYAKFTSEHSISPDGEKVYYMANSPDCGKSIGAEINHNMEGIYHLALGYYLSEGKDKKMLHQITTLIPPLLTKDPNDPRRKFNWTFRETSMAIWFLENARNHEQR